MSKSLMYSTLSEQGLRDNNEDMLIASSIGNDCFLFVCIDGIGGEEGGEMAAAIAASSIKSYLQDVKMADLDALKMAIVTANNNIIEMQKNPCVAHMGCVLTACLINTRNRIMHLCHVGDTRLYALHRNSELLSKLTKDDSFVGQMFDNGLISEKEAMTYTKRSRISKYLGSTVLNYFSEYFCSASVPIGWIQYLLLCSDGLYDVVGSNDIKMAMLNSESTDIISQELVEMALRHGGKDNISVIIIKFL